MVIVAFRISPIYSKKSFVNLSKTYFHLFNHCVMLPSFPFHFLLLFSTLGALLPPVFSVADYMPVGSSLVGYERLKLVKR